MSGKLKTLILEDDFFLKTILEMLCQQHPAIDYLGAFEDVSPARDFLEKEAVDLVLLDVQLKHSIGYQLLPYLPGQTQVVVISSHPHLEKPDQKFSITAFLSKPVQRAHFMQLIDTLQLQRAKHTS